MTLRPAGWLVPLNPDNDEPLALHELSRTNCFQALARRVSMSRYPWASVLSRDSYSVLRGAGHFL